VTAAAQSTAPAAGGIAQLTAATRQEAVECGNEGPSCALEPYRLCADHAAAYSVRLTTPFSRVASAALEARLDAQPLGRMGPGAVNPWGVSVTVSPAEKAPTPESIERVEIRRPDGTVVQPTWTTLGRVTTVTADGATRQLSRGFFVFPADAFAPTGDVTLVLTGLLGQAMCTIDRAHLSALR